MTRTWILQANPTLYDVDAALRARPVIYWRIPQYTDRVEQGDSALIWRAGKNAGFIGWGVFLTPAKRYDITRDDDPFSKSDVWDRSAEYYAPLRVWGASELPKAEVAEVIPTHRIVTAPMGTVFPLASEDRAALQPMLDVRGYDLTRKATEPIELLPVLPPPPESVDDGPVVTPHAAKITPAFFLLSSTPERPTEITVEADPLRMLLVERDALSAVDESWDSGGVYLLIGKPTSESATLWVYVGKAGGLRSRIKGHKAKDWIRCLLIQRDRRQPFDASEISWLERRLIDVLLAAPEFDVGNTDLPPSENVPDWKAEVLERTVVAAFGVLGVLGAYTA